MNREGSSVEINDPIHVKDILNYTEEFYIKALNKELVSKSLCVNTRKRKIEEGHGQIKESSLQNLIVKNNIQSGVKNSFSKVKVGAKVHREIKESHVKNSFSKVKVGAKAHREIKESHYHTRSSKNMININLVYQSLGCEHCHLATDISPLAFPYDLNSCLLTSYIDEDEQKLTYNKVLKGKYKKIGKKQSKQKSEHSNKNLAGKLFQFLQTRIK